MRCRALEKAGDCASLSVAPTDCQADARKAVLSYFELTLEGGFGSVSTECAAPFCTQFAGVIKSEVLAPGELFQSAALPTELPGHAQSIVTGLMRFSSPTFTKNGS